jgi:hypothetical protein
MSPWWDEIRPPIRTDGNVFIPAELPFFSQARSSAVRITGISCAAWRASCQRVGLAIGPPGRSSTCHCQSTSPPPSTRRTMTFACAPRPRWHPPPARRTISSEGGARREGRPVTFERLAPRPPHRSLIGGFGPPCVVYGPLPHARWGRNQALASGQDSARILPRAQRHLQ